MKDGYNVKNTGAQIVKAPKKVSVPSGVHGIRGKDVRGGGADNVRTNKPKA
jgi:hypothetical protein